MTKTKNVKKTKEAKKKSVAEIICDRLIKKIKENNNVPWQCTFENPFLIRNFVTKRAYRGINIFLLYGGYEYITYKQLKDYNLKHKTNFFIPDMKDYELVAFFKVLDRELTSEELQLYNNGCKNKIKNLIEDDNGPKVRNFMLRYTKVYDCFKIYNDKGEPLSKPQVSNDTINVNCSDLSINKAETIIKNYMDFSGVNHKYSCSCFYRETDDCIYTPTKSGFTNLEEYYRNVFHELAHSTGTKTRLARKMFKDYKKIKQHSREELVAELTSSLLSNFCGLNTTESVENSDNYILGWISYIENNPREVISAMCLTQKAADYILLKNDKEDNKNEDEVSISG